MANKQRVLEVLLKFRADRQGAQEMNRVTTEAAKRLNKLEQEAEEISEGVRRMRRTSVESLQQLKDHFEEAQQSASRLRETAERISSVGTTVAAVGASITAPLLLAARSYVQEAGKAEETSQRWLAATEDLTEAQRDVGRVVAQAALPYLEQAAELAERAARYAEEHPQAVENALKTGAVLTGIGAFVVAASQGIRLYADVKYLGAASMQMAAAKLMERAANKQAAAAGASKVGGGAAAAGGAGALGIGTVAGVVALGTAFQSAIYSTLFKGTDKIVDRLAGRDVYSSWDALQDVVDFVTSGFRRTQKAANEAADALSDIPDTGAGGRINTVRNANDPMNLAMNRYVGGQLDKRAAARDAVREAEEIAQKRAEQARQVADVREQAAQRAGQTEIRWERRAADEAIAAQRRKEDMARRVARQRAQIAEQYAQAITQAERSYHQTVQDAQEQHGKRVVDIERSYRQRIRDIQRDYSESLHEAVVNRDAAAIYRARRTRDRQLRDAKEQRDEQVRVANEQYQEQLQTARETLQEQRRMAAEARQQALEDLQESIRQELEAQRIADRRRLEDQARAKRREAEDRQRWLNYRLQQIYRTNTAEITAMQRHYQALAQMQRQYQQQMARYRHTNPSLPDSTPTPYASGGYTGAGGLSLLHPGEFVLNAQTTRRLEGSLGSLTQEKIVAGGRSVSVQIGAPQFVGVAQQDHGWIRQELRAFEGRLTNEVAKALEGA
jgi:hypothetical protein